MRGPAQNESLPTGRRRAARPELGSKASPGHQLGETGGSLDASPYKDVERITPACLPAILPPVGRRITNSLSPRAKSVPTRRRAMVGLLSPMSFGRQAWSPVERRIKRLEMTRKLC